MGYRRGGVLSRPPKKYRTEDYRAMLNLELLLLGVSAAKFGSQLYKNLPAESYAKNPQAYGMSPGEHLWQEFDIVKHPVLQKRSAEYANSLWKKPELNPRTDFTNDYMMEAEKRIAEGSLAQTRRFLQPLGVKPPDHISVETRISGMGKNRFKSVLATVAEETEDIDKYSYGKAILEKPSAAAQAVAESSTIQPYPNYKSVAESGVSSALKERFSRLGYNINSVKKVTRKKRK